MAEIDKALPNVDETLTVSQEEIEQLQDQYYLCEGIFKNLKNKAKAFELAREANLGDPSDPTRGTDTFGGYCISDIHEKEDPLRTTLRISQDDSHPNAAGHKFMADFLYDKYKEIYTWIH